MKFLALLILFISNTLLAIDLSEPGKYAFITDVESNKVAVYDLYNNKVETYLNLTVVPGIISVSRTQGVLVYGMKGSPVLYIIDLKTGKQRYINFSLGINQILFNPNGDVLAIAAREKVFLFDINSKTQNAIEITGLYYPINLMFNNGGEYLLIAEMARGKVSSYNISTKQKKQILKIDSSIAPIYLTPDSKYLLAGDIYNYNLHIVSVFDNSLNSVIPIKGIPIKPYVSNDGNTILVATEDKHIYSINSKNMTLEKEIKIKDFIYHIKTGWLDTTGMAVLASTILMFDVDSTNANSYFKYTELDIGDYITNTMVTADTKSLLLTGQYNSELIIIDIKTKQIKSKVKLDLVEANLIAIGLTDSIYH